MLYIHFIDHSQRQPDITFADFLSMHYLGNDLNDNDAEEDRKLPFKSPMAHSLTDIYFAQHSYTLHPAPSFTEGPKYPLPDHTSLPQRVNSDLFRPPRMA